MLCGLQALLCKLRGLMVGLLIRGFVELLNLGLIWDMDSGKGGNQGKGKSFQVMFLFQLLR